MAEVFVTGVAGRSMAASGLFFLRGASGSTLSAQSTAFRLRAVDVVVSWREPISPQ